MLIAIEFLENGMATGLSVTADNAQDLFLQLCEVDFNKFSYTIDKTGQQIKSIDELVLFRNNS